MTMSRRRLREEPCINWCASWQAGKLCGRIDVFPVGLFDDLEKGLLDILYDETRF